MNFIKYVHSSVSKQFSYENNEEKEKKNSDKNANEISEKKGFLYEKIIKISIWLLNHSKTKMTSEMKHKIWPKSS
jgi:hypothetical protein